MLVQSEAGSDESSEGVTQEDRVRTSEPEHRSHVFVFVIDGVGRLVTTDP